MVSSLSNNINSVLLTRCVYSSAVVGPGEISIAPCNWAFGNSKPRPRNSPSGEFDKPKSHQIMTFKWTTWHLSAGPSMLLMICLFFCMRGKQSYHTDPEDQFKLNVSAGAFGDEVSSSAISSLAKKDKLGGEISY